MNEDQIRRIIREEIEQTLGKFDNIPFSVQEALKARIGSGSEITVSSKGTDTEDVTVSEGGSSTYTVMDDPDGFLKVTVGGATRHIPYFSS